MLSYELCKKLKEAGLPQEINNSSPNLYYGKNADGSTESGVAFYPTLTLPMNYVKEPTLSELIEGVISTGAHGEFHLSALGKDLWDAAIREWFAPMRLVKSQGKTPEEAVANLYLSLNTCN